MQLTHFFLLHFEEKKYPQEVCVCAIVAQLCAHTISLYVYIYKEIACIDIHTHTYIYTYTIAPAERGLSESPPETAASATISRLHKLTQALDSRP